MIPYFDYRPGDRPIEAEIAAAGPRGPLHGVPVGLKDIFYTAGMKTAAGSKVYADFVPDFYLC